MVGTGVSERRSDTSIKYAMYMASRLSMGNPWIDGSDDFAKSRFSHSELSTLGVIPHI